MAGTNGSRPKSAAAAEESAVRQSLETPAAAGLLNVGAMLSRKLSWALSTSWEGGTGHKPPRGLINDMATRYATQIALELAASLPLHLNSPAASQGEGEVDRSP